MESFDKINDVLFVNQILLLRLSSATEMGQSLQSNYVHYQM